MLITNQIIFIPDRRNDYNYDRRVKLRDTVISPLIDGN
jgi:hypothetical protein